LKPAILFFLGLLASGCGAGMDFAPPYVANWAVMATLVAGGSSSIEQAALPVQRTDTNVIELQGFCADSDVYAEGPLADVTANGYAIRAGSCSYASAGCNMGNLGFQWASGGGTLSGASLTPAMGSLSGGTQSISYTLSFTSTDQTPYGGVTAAGTVGRATALRAFQD
jgi:hypothetical protein